MSEMYMRLKVTPLTPLYIEGVLNAKSTRKMYCISITTCYVLKSKCFNDFYPINIKKLIAQINSSSIY